MPVQRRHRSAVACQECRKRKVRCSVTATGIPCIRCAQDRSECTVQEPTLELPGVHFSSLTRNQSSNTTPKLTKKTHEIRTSQTSDKPSRNTASRFSLARSPVSSQVTPTLIPDTTGRRLDPDPERQRDINEEQSGAEISCAARGEGDTRSGIPFYTGENPGLTSIINVSSEPQQPMPRHILLNSTPVVSISQVDHNYLRHKGALQLLDDFSRKELLRAYFSHVHPLLPVFDLSKLPEFENITASSLSGMLLFWAMAVAAGNFVPATVWKTGGFTSRKQMKDTMYTRAKCMYDNGGVTDKEVLLQCALLLSFWHSDRDSQSQPWYWSGVAISLGQIIGLHRNPDSVKYNPLVSLRRRQLWRRLWASCLYRDRWLSLTLGRPMRIRLCDCDMPSPTLDDVLSDLAEVPVQSKTEYVPWELVQLAEHWIMLLRLSVLLGKVLALCYEPGSGGTQQFNGLEVELLEFQVPELDGGFKSRLTRFSHYHLQLHHQAVLITFYRFSLTSKTPQQPVAEVEEPWRDRIQGRLENAAVCTNTILDLIAQEQLVGYAGPMTPPLLVPAMHVHLLNCKSPHQLIRRLGFNKLELCMIMMRELQKVHTSASIFCGIFGEAVRQLMPGNLDESIWGLSERNRATVATDTATNDTGALPFLDDPNALLQPFVNDDVLASLLDESSIQTFWESMNQSGGLY